MRPLRMPTLPPELLTFARDLIFREGRTGGKSGESQPVAFRVCDKLRRPLAKLMGLSAFIALLSRALKLAQAKAPCLDVVHIADDGSLAGLAEMEEECPEAPEAEIVLVAQLLGLLITFVGKGLTVRLVREIWPEVSLNELNSENPPNHD